MAARSMQWIRSNENPYVLRQWTQVPLIGTTAANSSLWGFAGTLQYTQDEATYFQMQWDAIQLELADIFRYFLEKDPVPGVTAPTFEVVDSIANNVCLTVMVVLNPTAEVRTSIGGMIQYMVLKNQKGDQVITIDAAKVLQLQQICAKAMGQYALLPAETDYIKYVGPHSSFFQGFLFQTKKESASNLTSEFLVVPCFKHESNDYLLLGDGEQLLRSDLRTFESTLNGYATARRSPKYHGNVPPLLFPGLPAMIHVWKLVHQYGSDRSMYLRQLPQYAFSALMLRILNTEATTWWQNKSFKQIFDAGFEKLIQLLDLGTTLSSPYLQTKDLLFPFGDDEDELREWCQIWLAVPESDLLPVLNGCITYT